MGKSKSRRKAVDRLLAQLLAPRPAGEDPATTVDGDVVRQLNAHLEANPGDSATKFNLGLAHFWADPDKSKEFLEAACAGQVDDPLRWISLMCHHVVRWRLSHHSEDSLAAWTIIQRNQRLLWSVASPSVLQFFGLVFKFHGDFDRAFKVAHEFVVRHPDKPFTPTMARLGAEVAFARGRHRECMRLLETLTVNDPRSAGAGAGATFDADKAALYFLQCRMYDVAAAGGRKPINRGVSYKWLHPEGTLASL